jgi:hypothetical protein
VTGAWVTAHRQRVNPASLMVKITLSNRSRSTRRKDERTKESSREHSDQQVGPFLRAIFRIISFILHYVLTTWSTVFLEKLTGYQLHKKFPSFYGTRRFITAFIGARQLPLS